MIGVKKIAKRVRKKVEGFSKTTDFYFPDLECWCAISSELLYRELAKHGIPSTFVVGSYKGYGHAWIEVNGCIVDITATQFGVTKRVYVVKNTNKKYNGKLFGKAAFNDVYTTWPADQTLNYFPELRQ